MSCSADDDKPQHECGVFGVYGEQDNAARVAFFALYALQHRGQESAGIATSHQHTFHVHKGMGLVSQVFTEAAIETLPGKLAIGHNRYSTADLGQIAVAHNGQLARHRLFRKALLARGTGLFTDSDSELIAQMLARPLSKDEVATAAQALGVELNLTAKDTEEAKAAPKTELSPPTWEGRVSALLELAEGAYSFVMLTRDAVYGVRDRLGMRPLCIGRVDGGVGHVAHCLSSESCALGTIGAEYVREVSPGEMVRLDAHGLHSFQAVAPSPTPAMCVFEYVYFARPDSLLEDQLVHAVRQRLGAELAREAPVPDADVVSGVPDSSIAAAVGFAGASGQTFTEVFCKNRYIGRTFIQPDDTLRQNAIQLKYNPLSENIAGKKIVLVDDSLVRGNTLRKLVPLLKNAGAAEVHVRISSPPIRHPCYMGVDIGTYEELIAHNVSTVEQICKHIKADSLAFLSQEGMMRAVRAGLPDTTADGKDRNAGHCVACFTGEYPLQVDNW